MEALPASYMPGDAMLIENIVWELKSQGIFDTFRKECIADVDTKPAYQNLRQRVEGSVSSFLRKQTWSANLNKNQVREQLRKNIYESGYLETGVERIVDQVVNPKMSTVFLPKVTDVVYQYLGLQKPEGKSEKEKEEELKTRSEELLPKELEAVSPESCHAAGDDSNLSLESMKIDDDESPPFEPLDEDNSIDSHMSGISGLQSHDSNTSLKTLQIDEADASGSNSCPIGGASGADSAENDTMEVAPSTGNTSEVMQEGSQDSNSNSRLDSKKDGDTEDKLDDKIDDKLDNKEKSKDRDREKIEKRSRSESKSSSKDKYRDKDKSSKDKERDSKGRDKDKDNRDKSRSDKDKDRHRSRHDKKGDRRDKDKDRNGKDSKSTSSSSSKSRSRHESSRDRDRKTSSSSSRNDKDKDKEKRDGKQKEKKDKDDHYSSKQKGGERRSTDRDSNDGSGLKSSSSSYCESNSSSQHSHKEKDSNSNDSGQSGTDKTEKSKTSTVKTKMEPPPVSISVSAASWDALEAQLNSNVMNAVNNYEDTSEDDKKSAEEDWKYFSLSSIEEDASNLEKSAMCLGKLQREIADVAGRLSDRRRRRKRVDGADDSLTPSPPAKKARSLIVGRVFVSGAQKFHLPLSPAESDSDKSTDRKAEEMVVTATAEVRRKAVQRYSSDDLYKPRPVIGRSTTRTRGKVDSY